ncbi:hypothetical protein D8S78_22950 [Natrialba swarupiae]|nr:hypothetical protein [Natrialba swarupiae]
MFDNPNTQYQSQKFDNPNNQYRSRKTFRERWSHNSRSTTGSKTTARTSLRFFSSSLPSPAPEDTNEKRPNTSPRGYSPTESRRVCNLSSVTE